MNPILFPQSIFKRILAIALYTVIFILFLSWLISPYIVRHYLGQALAPYKVELSPSSTVRYNPFLSAVSIDDLIIKSSSEQTLLLKEAYIELHLHRLLFKSLHIAKFEVDTLDIKIEKQQDKLLIAGMDFNNADQTTESETSEPQTPEEKSEQTTQSPADDYTVNIPKLRIKHLNILAIADSSEHTLNFTEIGLDKTKLNLIDQRGKLGIEALVNQAPLSLELKFDLSKQAGTISAELDLKSFDLASLTSLPELPVKTLEGTLSLASEATVELTDKAININVSQLDLLTEALNVEYTPWLYQSESQRFVARDAQISVLDGELSSLKTQLDFLLKQSKASLSTPNNILASWDSIESNGIQLSQSDEIQVEIPAVVFKNLAVSEPSDNSAQQPDAEAQATPAMALFQQLAINQISASPTALNIDNIELAGLDSAVLIDEQKNIQTLVDLSALETEPTEEVATSTTEDPQKPSPDQPTEQSAEAPQPNDATEAEDLFAIALGKLTLTQPAKIHFRDQSVNPVYERTFTISELNVGKLDNQKPQEATPFNIKGESNEYATFDMQGNFAPFTEKLNAKTVGKVRELSLPSVSSYIKDSLGFELQSGQLDTDIDVSIVDDKIDGKTDIFIRGLKMSTANDYEEGTIKEGKAMPLNVALNMLKDKKGNLKLGIPMQGDTSNPSFGVRHFIGLIVKKAAMSQTKKYLMNTFVPYASVVSVALTGADYLLQIRVEPLLFSPQITDLNEAQSQYLKELALLMADKEKLQIRTCALSTPADVGLSGKQEKFSEEHIQALQSHGKKRQAQLKEYLVKQGIESSRILFCAPEIDNSDDGQPRIEIKTS